MTQEYSLKPLDQAETTETLQRYVDDAVADGWTLHTMLPKLIVFSRSLNSPEANFAKAVEQIMEIANRYPDMDYEPEVTAVDHEVPKPIKKAASKS